MDLNSGAFQGSAGGPGSSSGSSSSLAQGIGLRYVADGSSYTQQASGWSANKISNGLRGRTSWINYRNNQQFEYDIWRCYDPSISAWRLIGGNQGFGGQLSADILAGLPLVLALKPDIIDLQIGDNDLSTLAAAVTMANVKAYCDQALKAGVQQIWLNGCYPRMISDSGWPAGNVARKRRNALNRMKRDYAAITPGVTYINNDQTMLNPASANGEALPGLLYDGIHKTLLGALRAAQSVEQATSQQVGKVQWSVAGDDAYDAVENPMGNMIANGILQGATGVASGTGQYPTGAANNSSGTGLTQTLTTLADGTLELVITTTGKDAGNVQLADNLVAYGGFTFVIPGTFAKDLAFRMKAPVTYLVGPAVLGLRGQIRGSGTVDGASKTYFSYDMENYSISTQPIHYTTYWPCQTESMPGTVRPPSLISESDDTAIRFGFQVYVNPAVAGTTTVRIKGMIGGLVDLPWVRYGVARDHGLSTAPATEAQI